MDNKLLFIRANTTVVQTCGNRLYDSVTMRGNIDTKTFVMDVVSVNAISLTKLCRDRKFARYWRYLVICGLLLYWGGKYMIKLAKHILSMKEDISTLNLQHTMFFSIGNYIKEHGIDFYIMSIYTEPFEAWDFSPTHRETTYQHRYGELKSKYDERYVPLNKYIEKYMNQEKMKLTEIYHNKPLFIKYKESILDREYIPKYTLEMIKNDFME